MGRTSDKGVELDEVAGPLHQGVFLDEWSVIEALKSDNYCIVDCVLNMAVPYIKSPRPSWPV